MATLALGAGLVALVPLVDEHVLEWIVTWDPGPRLDPLLAAAILFGPASVVLASASPIAVRLAARSLERLGRTAGRLFSVSTAGSIVGTFATAFWLVPELGTDQVLAVGATTLLVAALTVALTVRLQAVAVLLAAGLAGALALTLALSPEREGELQGVAAQNWSPLYRQRDDRTPGPLDPASLEALAQSGFTIREARETRYHRLIVADSTEIALPAFRQLVPERHVAFRPLPHALPLHRLPRPRPRVQPGCTTRAVRRARRRFGAEADVA